MRVALYARVSTDEQDTAGQRIRLEDYARLMGWEVAGYYEDHACGADDSRPALDRLREDAGVRGNGIYGRSKFDAVVVTKLDRVMRSLTNLEHLISDLDAVHVSLISIDQGINTAADSKDPSRRLVRQIIGAVAEWERETIRQRVKEGMAKAKRLGTKSGRPIGRPRLSGELSKDALRMRRLRERRKLEQRYGVSPLNTDEGEKAE